MNKVKQELENTLIKELPEYLHSADNRSIEYLIISLIRDNGVLDVGTHESGEKVKLAFSCINGIPTIQRYEVAKNEDAGNISKIFGVAATFTGRKQMVTVDQFKEDLLSVENGIMQLLVMAYEEDLDLSFMQISGLSYKYYSDENTDTPGALIITAMVDDDGDVIFKYSTDTAVNMAFKDDSSKVSAI